MARTLFYFISSAAPEGMTACHWQTIEALRDFYNREFYLDRRRIQLAPVEYMPRWPEIYPDSLLGTNDYELGWRLIQEQLHSGRSLEVMEREKLIVTKQNPENMYLGITQTRNNHWDAFLVCEFLLKVSYLSPDLSIEVFDESDFIPSGHLIIRNGEAEAQLSSSYIYWVKQEKVEWMEKYVLKNRELWESRKVFLPLERSALAVDLEKSKEIPLPIHWDKLFTTNDEHGILDLNTKCQEVLFAPALQELMDEMKDGESQLKD
jgi:hypothetical protein